MTALKLIKELSDYVYSYGDAEIKIGVLTENELSELQINEELIFDTDNKTIILSHDFDDYNEFKAFKRNLK